MKAYIYAAFFVAYWVVAICLAKKLDAYYETCDDFKKIFRAALYAAAWPITIFAELTKKREKWLGIG